MLAIPIRDREQMSAVAIVRATMRTSAARKASRPRSSSLAPRKREIAVAARAMVSGRVISR